MQRDSATAVYCAYVRKVHCAVFHTWFVDVTSFAIAVVACMLNCWCNNGVGHFEPIFQVIGNTFRPIFFGYFIADWLLYNSAAGSFHTTKFCSRLHLIEIECYSKKLKNRFLSHRLGDLGVMYALHQSNFFHFLKESQLQQNKVCYKVSSWNSSIILPLESPWSIF